MARFLFLADPQLGCYASFSGMTAADVERFAERGMRVRPVPRTTSIEWDARRYALAIAEANRLRPDFIVVGGDMIDDASDEAQTAEFFRITRALDPTIPVRWVPGNHDAATDGVTATAESLSRYRELFGVDYYTFSHEDVRYVVVNTVVASNPEHVPREWDEQLRFLEEALVGARAAGQSVVLFGHHPLFVESADEEDDYWNVPRAQRAPILALLHEHDVRLAFAGHRHRNSVARDGNLELVTSGPIGYPLGDDPSGYRLVEVTRDGVSHEYVPLPEPADER